MNFSRFFVDRPIFAAVLSIVITLVGALAYFGLPISQYPEIVPPTVVVTATYPGADARTLAETVATPLEQEINGVEDMLYLSSSSTSDGRVQITVTFKLGTDLDKAQVLVQNKINSAIARLPEEVRRLGVTAQKRSPDLTLAAQFYSPDGSREVGYLSNYVTLQIQNEIARLPGVAEASSLGGLDYSMRVWLDPEKVAALGLTAGDIVQAIREQNVQVAAGSLGQPPAPVGAQFQYTLTAPGRLKTAEQFGGIVLKTGANGSVVRLTDVARIEIGSRDYSSKTYMDGNNAVSLRVFQLPGSNSLETADAVYKTLERLKERFPPGVDYSINYDTTKFVRASIESVLHTLIEAVLLVVLVVILFLQTWRASIIPLLAVPVSLIGTLAIMQAFGFSLNNLSLFGLVLAIGIVVDDAIVVVENVERNIARGLSPRDAAVKAMEEVSGPIIAVALVLCAVFIPTAFISGITGQFYKQFAITIAASTVLSAINSLTLSPALCAILLPKHGGKRDGLTRFLDFLLGWFFRGFNRLFQFGSKVYAGTVKRMLRLAVIVLIVYAFLVGGAIELFRTVPTGFIPTQDMGYLIVVVQLPDGASFERTDAVVQKVDEIGRNLKGVAHTFAISGYSSVLQANQSNVGAAFLVLDEFNKRTDPSVKGDVLLADIRKAFSTIKEARVLVLPPAPIRGLGSAGGFKIQVQDLNNAGLPALEAATKKLLDAAQNEPKLTSLITGFRANVPQYHIDIDRAQAKTMGVSLADLNESLQVYLGSVYVNDFNLFGRTYQVTAQAESSMRTAPEDLLRIKIRNQNGEMVPLGALVKVEKQGGADRVQRYNLYYSADINGNTQPGVSSGEMIRLVEDLAKDNLPNGFSIEWTDLTFQQILAGNTIFYIFPLCVVFVFLVLAAQYESWNLPLAIIFIVPMCLLSAIGGVWLRDMDNNIFTQIGLVVLVGLAAKNAILIVEFAKQMQDQGMDRYSAAIEACRLRLRPILMTSMAFILGVLPLVLARGAGAEMRQALGTAVFYGMLGVTIFGLLFTPVFYVVLRRFAGDRSTHPRD
ncbi:MAG: multidrug efflux RND transporter permease subunit [Verrucomicrobiales bacterium]|jgi:hydrophobe/amphiphile efflux-1 (HAE1) family protein|nr:multidrug efflux RND transporter permease subunit [Verrucomicrobiales bacterium]MBP9223026.1 multidrug efflux RND transporter permease subunit [Verrucomicrobiales bacterium]